MSFATPYFLIAIPALVLPWLVWALWRQKRREAALAFPLLKGFAFPPSLRTKLRWLPPVLRALALALIVVAAAGPRVRSDSVPIERKGLDIVVVFDVSTSMKALDFEPSDRFTVARDTIGEFVRGRPNDRIGLVVFAGEAFTQCPLTLDHAVLLNILSSIKMEVIPDGTAIGDALAVAVNRLRESEAKSKVIVLLTDGDNNRGKLTPEKAAQMAAEFGIRIHTVQVGTGGQVPYPVRDMFGVRKQLAEIAVNPELLRKLAADSKGRYFVARDSRALKDIFGEIDRLETSLLPGEEFVAYEEVFGYAALPAALLLVLEVLLSALWFRRFP